MIYKYPANFARFYDTMYHQLRDATDNEYFQNEIQRSGGKILEIGVGTGRLFIDALNRGADIYGLDLSESMLEMLYKKLKSDQHYRISHQNILDFSYDFKFDLIVAPFRVIMHLLDIEEQIQAIDNVYNHLNSNGRFIFDVFVPDLNQLIKGVNNQMDFEGEYEPDKKIRRFVSTTPDLINQTITVNFHLEWEENNELKHDEWVLPLRFFFRYELEHLLQRSKFEEYKIYGDYKGSELNKDSKEFIIVFQKK
jgi:SAM-dependent methyltransferase